ncbi:alpha/beta fold hydrolase [Janibacter corallicola]|uniref:alpha/beta fold hydrolase n=1 Tax=Janibacter corallicola TaxID=415212 RepID=UPI00082F3453|nr:alpha/beta hydrolase [Janibacter corallicola]
MTSTIEYTHLEGAGEPVVLIHGIGHRRQAWGRVPELLNERGHDVYTVDLPGHGESPRPTKPDGWSMESTAAQHERLFADLGLDHPHVLGNSLGGLVALELAHRGSVRSATAYSPAGFYPPYHLVNVGANLLFMKGGSYLPEAAHRRLNTYPWFRRVAFRSLYTHPENVTAETAVADTLNLRRAKGFWPHFVRATFARFTKDVQVPTTIAWGEHDRLLLPSEAQVARRRLSGATHVSLPDCGHCPQVDHPELVADVAEATFVRAAEQVPTDSP